MSTCRWGTGNDRMCLIESSFLLIIISKYSHQTASRQNSKQNSKREDCKSHRDFKVFIQISKVFRKLFLSLETNPTWRHLTTDRLTSFVFYRIHSPTTLLLCEFLKQERRKFISLQLRMWNNFQVERKKKCCVADAPRRCTQFSYRSQMILILTGTDRFDFCCRIAIYRQATERNLDDSAAMIFHHRCVPSRCR